MKRAVIRCPICKEGFISINKYKCVCRNCSKKVLTKSWVLGVTAIDAQKCLIEKIQKGYNLKEIALCCDVTEQTLVSWFKKFFGKTYKEVKRSVFV